MPKAKTEKEEIEQLKREFCPKCPASLKCLKGEALRFCAKCECCHWYSVDPQGNPLITYYYVLCWPKQRTHYYAHAAMKRSLELQEQLDQVQSLMSTVSLTSSGRITPLVYGTWDPLSGANVVFEDPITGNLTTAHSCARCVPTLATTVNSRHIDLNQKPEEPLTPVLGLADTLAKK